MSKLLYHLAKFLISVAYLNQLPIDEGAEVAFVGRSNAGKSSAINALTNQKNLARASKTPGRTQLINFFEFDDQRRLVDLPGFGFAKASTDAKKKWEKLIDAYLSDRSSLKGLVLLMDIRHVLMPFDLALLEWCSEIQLPVHVLLTKADKLSRMTREKALKLVQEKIKKEKFLATVQCFSSTKKIGIDELKTQLDHWFD